MFLREPNTISALVQVIVKCIDVDPIHLANVLMRNAFHKALESKTSLNTSGIRIFSIFGGIGNRYFIKNADEEIKIISASFPQLESLTLGRACQFSDYGLKHLGALTRLKELCLVFGFHINDEGVRYVAENCLQLEIVRLVRCRRLTNNSLEAFREHKLKYFEFSDNDKISEDGIEIFVKSKAGKVLQVLNFSETIPLSQNCIEFLFGTCSSLEKLHYQEVVETTEFFSDDGQRVKMRTPGKQLGVERNMYDDARYRQFNTVNLRLI
jgi:hypothetical protein